ncbi:MAG: glycosyltransferase family 2 protein [Bacteroidetes bacterium]|nr:glycosyltransferase family 2 protein [Bacteroidota bacterium]
MKVSGFTIVRNAIKFDYPVAEAIRSILPVCDEFIVAAGNSDDATRELIASIEPAKIRIIDSVWDDKLREGGSVLAVETNKALDAVSEDTDWAFYIQADEVVHEKFLPAIHEGMERWQDNASVEGLLFNYLHFFGSYDYLASSRDWYRREVRIIRKQHGIRSYRYAQGFRNQGRKLNVKPLEAWVYHYGWVKPPGSQQAKQESFQKHWHDDEWVKNNIPPASEFDYNIIGGLKKFEGSHPEVIKKRISSKNWEFRPNPGKNKLTPVQKALQTIENLVDWRIGEYKNYKII